MEYDQESALEAERVMAAIKRQLRVVEMFNNTETGRGRSNALQQALDLPNKIEYLIECLSEKNTTDKSEEDV